MWDRFTLTGYSTNTREMKRSLLTPQLSLVILLSISCLISTCLAMPSNSKCFLSMLYDSCKYFAIAGDPIDGEYYRSSLMSASLGDMATIIIDPCRIYEQTNIHTT